MTYKSRKPRLPSWMAPVPNPAPVKHRRTSDAAKVEGGIWADFECADGRRCTSRGRKRRATGMLIDAMRSGTGVLRTEMPGNGADTMRMLAEAGISIGRVQKLTQDGATVGGVGRTAIYVLLEPWHQVGKLYADDSQAQLAMDLSGRNKASGKPLSARQVTQPYVDSGLIPDHLAVVPLNANKSAAAKSITRGTTVRAGRVKEKKARKRLNRNLPLAGGGKRGPAT